LSFFFNKLRWFWECLYTSYVLLKLHVTPTLLACRSKLSIGVGNASGGLGKKSKYRRWLSYILCNWSALGKLLYPPISSLLYSSSLYLSSVLFAWSVGSSVFCAGMVPGQISVGAAKCYCSTIMRNDRQHFSCISHRGVCMNASCCLRGSKIVTDQWKGIIEDLFLLLLPFCSFCWNFWRKSSQI